ncbi:MAG: hypothetical protein GC189_05615 [Alphaproteobacteria bacterium]|nr:hypothetical protein [Alphaproteobacteria bacterium]
MSVRSVIVAVTGHRLNQLPVHERPRIEAEIARALDEVEDASRDISAGPVKMTMCSAIAEGADRYAAEAALVRGWRLVTPLPFHPERYTLDFENEASVRQFYGLLQASRKVAPVEKHVVEAIGGDAAPYAAVGRALIEKADVLLAVWNGLPPKGPGGTSEVAALMLEKGGLVLWISAAEPKPARLVPPAPLPRAGSFRRKLYDTLTARFERIVRPPEMRAA